MSVIYLKHPRHGTKVATSEDEAKADEKQGWERLKLGAILTPEEPAEVRKPESLPVNALADDLKERYREKFGKLPHWKKSPESIRRELEAA